MVPQGAGHSPRAYPRTSSSLHARHALPNVRSPPPASRAQTGSNSIVQTSASREEGAHSVKEGAGWGADSPPSTIPASGRGGGRSSPPQAVATRRKEKRRGRSGEERGAGGARPGLEVGGRRGQRAKPPSPAGLSSMVRRKKADYKKVLLPKGVESALLLRGVSPRRSRSAPLRTPRQGGDTPVAHENSYEEYPTRPLPEGVEKKSPARPKGFNRPPLPRRG